MGTSDAKYVRTWRFEPFPIYAEKAEEILKENLPKDAKNHKRWMMIVRRSDDVPVGSVNVFSYKQQYMFLGGVFFFFFIYRLVSVCCT